jgi:hypothetical protein
MKVSKKTTKSKTKPPKMKGTLKMPAYKCGGMKGKKM